MQTNQETITDLVRALETAIPYLQDILDQKNRDMEISAIGAELALAQARAAIERAKT